VTNRADPPTSFDSNIWSIPFEGANDKLPTKEAVGSKAHNLMRMAACGLTVPPGFVLETSLCRAYLQKGAAALEGINGILHRKLQQLGERTNRRFGYPRRPLLVSVRSGAVVSMPGMMETVLNIGLNDETLRGLIRMTGNPRLAQDCRRRLVQQYGEVVRHIAPDHFENRLKSSLAGHGLADIEELDTNSLREIGNDYLVALESAASQPFPKDPWVQLRDAVEAVLRSWSSPRAQEYRRLSGIPDDLGTAVIVQAMVFGNWGPTSGSGVGFTRNPADGDNALYVDYLANAQGEDVVGGRRKAVGLDALQRRAPDAYRSLLSARAVLERQFADMQDFEFTVEQGQLYFLQCRAGKRTPLAALQIAHDLVEELAIAPAEALRRLAGLDLESIEAARLQPHEGQAPLIRGTPASNGVAIGAVLFDPERLATIARSGKAVILVRQSAETGDIRALSEAAALLTVDGARTSHAAVVARQLGKVCIVGCEGLCIDPSLRRGVFGSETLLEGEVVSVDGATGAVFRGEMAIAHERPVTLLKKVESWRHAASAPHENPFPSS